MTHGYEASASGAICSDSEKKLYAIEQNEAPTGVKPGDVFETECEITASKGPFYFAKGKGTVGGKLCVSAEFSFAVLQNKGEK